MQRVLGSDARSFRTPDRGKETNRTSSLTRCEPPEPAPAATNYAKRRCSASEGEKTKGGILKLHPPAIQMEHSPLQLSLAKGEAPTSCKAFHSPNRATANSRTIVRRLGPVVLHCEVVHDNFFPR